MAKGPTKSASSQVHIAHAASIEVPLPLLSALEDVEHAFFGLCVISHDHDPTILTNHDPTRDDRRWS